jgi:hypothetical protein
MLEFRSAPQKLNSLPAELYSIITLSNYQIVTLLNWVFQGLHPVLSN